MAQAHCVTHCLFEAFAHSCKLVQFRVQFFDRLHAEQRSVEPSERLMLSAGHMENEGS